MNPVLAADLGPWQYVPLLNNEGLINQWRNIGGQGAFLAAESGNLANTIVAYQTALGTPWDEPTPTGQWVNYCGYILYTLDGLGNKTNSGYNLVWQYRITNVYFKPDVITPIVIGYRLEYRIAKVSQTNPLDIESLASFNYYIAGPEDTESFSLGIIAGVNMEHSEKTWLGFGFTGAYVYIRSGTTYQNATFAIPCISNDWLESHHYSVDDEVVTDPNQLDPEGPSKPGGGDGTHDRRDEEVGLPDLPDLGALDAGMITLYRMTSTDMSNFTGELWTFWQGIKSFFADPLDFVVGCMIMPFEPESTRMAYPKFGGDTWSTPFHVISQQYYSFSCGSIDIDKYYGSCFDYDPYQKIQIFIPFVGYRELPVDHVVGKTIELTYHIDCMTGEFVAFIHTPTVGEWGPQLAQIICQFAGTMGVNVPLSRQTFDNAVQAGINLIGGAVGMAAGGIAMAAGLDGQELNASQIANQASSATVSAINAAKRNVIRSGSIGATSGFLAKLRPFIIRTLPRQSLPRHYADLEGYPSNIYGLVGDFSGYLAIESVKLQVMATEPEKDMIMQLLKGGIYL
jgi:hypothetical protein